MVPEESNLTADSLPRGTGIPFLGDMPWGTHICVFYETKEDLLDTAASYFKAGLESNEFCVWAVPRSVSQEDARDLLRRSVPNIDARMAAGQIEILQGYEWYLKGGQFDLKRITAGWNEKLHDALTKGYEGMRASGDTLWVETKLWKKFSEYEQEVDRSLAGQKMIAMCTYSLGKSRAVDILDVARTHHCTLARRNGEWEFMETPELAKLEITNILSGAFPGSDLLTPRERAVLAQLAKGATSKEAGRALGISPRTVDFHRADILKRLNAKNLVDLIRKVTSEES